MGAVRMGMCVGAPWEVCWPPEPGRGEGERNRSLEMVVSGALRKAEWESI